MPKNQILNPVFVSYRRSDCPQFARRLRAELASCLGSDDLVFFDEHAIRPGVKFPTEIRERLWKSSAMIVVIGKDWLNKRLFAEGDWCRTEIELALKRGIPIIPVIAKGAKLPSEKRLPKSIAMLRDFQAIEQGNQSVPTLSTTLAQVVRKQGFHLKTEQWTKSVGDDEEPWWEWKVWLAGKKTQLDQVNCVRYTLHPTYEPPTREESDRASGFAHEGEGWGDFVIQVAVELNDHRVIKMRHSLVL